MMWIQGKLSTLIIVLLSLTLILSSLVRAEPARTFRCEAVPSIAIEAGSPDMVPYICSAAERVLGFLQPYQLHAQRPILIEIVEQSLSHRGYKAYGSYNRQSDRVTMMSLPAILAMTPSPTMYDTPFDKGHYIGALAHEITHALFQHNAPPIEDKWNNAAQEYLAHAVQLGVLAEERRQKIIRGANTGPWETGDEVSVTYMAFNPTGFAVKSYLHLTGLSEPQAFVKLLLNHKWLYVSIP